MTGDEAPKSTPEEARATLEAITSGGVDAIVVDGPLGPQVLHLESLDQPFRTFVERMQEGALTVALDGTILFANAYFTQLVGQPADSLVGTSLVDLTLPAYRSTLRGLIQSGGEGQAKGHCVLSSPSGPISVQLTLSSLVGGSRPCCCVVVFDLREREAAEVAHAARLAAEQASTAKDRFLAVLSHELRAPLNAILGWSQILAHDESLGPEARHAAGTIERNSRTQAQLIGDLLDISRIVAGKLNLESSVHELSSLVEAVVSGVTPLAAQAGVSLSYEGHPSAAIYGDATRVQQIIMNLLSNAIKFTGRGGRVEVQLEEKHGRIELRVVDNGMGLSPEALEQIFELFHQEGATRRRQAGLGLGLSIARQLAEAHGGHLHAQSEGEGRGSVFVLDLPITAHLPSFPSQPGRQGELSGICVLVIDDEDDSLDLTRYLLERAGCSVVTAHSAPEALEELESQPFGLIVSDIGLPIQDGLDLMREVRARGFDSNRLPAIAVTGYAGIHDARLVAAAGYQRHLPKPIEAADLLRAVGELGRRARTVALPG